MFPRPALKKTLELQKFFVCETRIQHLICQFDPRLHFPNDSCDNQRRGRIDHNQITPRAAVTVRKDVR